MGYRPALRPECGGRWHLQMPGKDSIESEYNLRSKSPFNCHRIVTSGKSTSPALIYKDLQLWHLGSDCRNSRLISKRPTECPKRAKTESTERRLAHEFAPESTDERPPSLDEASSYRADRRLTG